MVQILGSSLYEDLLLAFFVQFQTPLIRIHTKIYHTRNQQTGDQGTIQNSIPSPSFLYGSNGLTTVLLGFESVQELKPPPAFLIHPTFIEDPSAIRNGPTMAHGPMAGLWQPLYFWVDGRPWSTAYLAYGIFWPIMVLCQPLFGLG